jgi:hypothetical protein
MHDFVNNFLSLDFVVFVFDFFQLRQELGLGLSLCPTNSELKGVSALHNTNQLFNVGTIAWDPQISRLLIIP